MAKPGERNADFSASKDIESSEDNSSGCVSKNSAPLLFGHFEIAPQRLFNVLLATYSAFFLVHRLADVTYLLTVDAKFPEGLEYLYKSEAERLRALSYTRQTVVASMFCQTVVFVVVMMLARTRALVIVDEVLNQQFSDMGVYLSSFPSIFQVTGRCCSGCFLWFSDALLDRCCCGFKLKWSPALRGAVYLTLASACFNLLQAPFQIWMYNINVKFGFLNVITTPPATFKVNLVLGFAQILIKSAPAFFVYLLMLQFRAGWFLMWAGMILTSTVAQYHMGTMAPMIFNGVFPDSDFAVARGFPVVRSVNESHPWVSLNRIYYENNEMGTFQTQDNSKGPVELAAVKHQHGKDVEWVFKDMDAGMGSEPLAKTVAKVNSHQNNRAMLKSLSHQSWESGDQPDANAHLGVRHGKKLRKSLFEFAKDHGISVGDVYMVDGSYQDARANAFVAGAGGDRAIGLYDTLFLGDHLPAKSPDNSGNDISYVGQALRSFLLKNGFESKADGGPVSMEEESRISIQRMSEVLRAADASEGKPRPLWRTAPTRAMTDAEILAILGHELGHSALQHVEHGMVVQGVSSFATFALLGWMVHSPLLAASFSLAAPVGHVAVFAYNHIAGATLDGLMRIITDGISRSNEYAADAYSAQESKKYATGLQTALAKLTVSSSQDPSEPWFYEALHSDHPSFARRWGAIAKIQNDLYRDVNEDEDKEHPDNE